MQTATKYKNELKSSPTPESMCPRRPTCVCVRVQAHEPNLVGSDQLHLGELVLQCLNHWFQLAQAPGLLLQLYVPTPIDTKCEARQ